jgi:hypothetical protein
MPGHPILVWRRQRMREAGQTVGYIRIAKPRTHLQLRYGRDCRIEAGKDFGRFPLTKFKTSFMVN